MKTSPNQTASINPSQSPARCRIRMVSFWILAMICLHPLSVRAGDAFRFIAPQFWAAGGSNTTYQEWDHFTGTSSNVPDVGWVSVPAAGGDTRLSALPPAALAGSGNFYAFMGDYVFRADVYNNTGTTGSLFGTHVIVQTAATLSDVGGTVLPGSMQIVDLSGAPLTGGEASSALRYDVVYSGLVPGGPAGEILQREEIWEFFLPSYVGDFRVQATLQKHSSLRQVRIDTHQVLRAHPLVRIPLLHPESNFGDFSNDGNAPSSLGELGAGFHQISLHFGDDGENNDDSDVLSFEVPPGYEIISIKLLEYAVDGDSGSGSFFAIADAPTIGTTIPTATNHLSNQLLSSPGELLESLAAGAFYGASRIVPYQPLPAGTYTLFFSETSAGVDLKLGVTVSRLPLEFQLLAWGDGSATTGLPSAAGLKPSATMPTAGDWLIFTDDDQALPAANNPAGALSHNLVDITGAGGAGFNMAPSLTGSLSLRIEPISRAGLAVTVEELAYAGQANAVQAMNQFLVSRGDAATTNAAFQVDGERNSGRWEAHATNNWAIQFALDFYFATNADGVPDADDVDATFSDVPHSGFLIPVSQLTSTNLATLNLDDPLGFYTGDFEAYLLEQIKPRLPTNATYLLITQMGKSHPSYAEAGLPITTNSLVGNTTIAYTTQTVADAPEMLSVSVENAQPAVRFSGNVGLDYIVQRSEDLVAWETVLDPALSHPVPGEVEWLAPVDSAEQQFYRMLPVSP
ncbi:MAG: hypothetical protein J5I99_09185 [Verrucomicrobia bacterium]|nr:hypothetical protein [Verrucomicrobiota bacterium]